MLQMVLVVVGFQPAQLPLLLPPGTLLLQPSLHLGLHASQCFNHSSYFPPSYLFWQKTRVILISQSYAPWFTCFRIVFVFAVLPYGKFWSATSVLHCNYFWGRVLLPNRMNFWKDSKRPLTPHPPNF